MSNAESCREINSDTNSSYSSYSPYLSESDTESSYSAYLSDANENVNLVNSIHPTKMSKSNSCQIASVESEIKLKVEFEHDEKLSLKVPHVVLHDIMTSNLTVFDSNNNNTFVIDADTLVEMPCKIEIDVCKDEEVIYEWFYDHTTGQWFNIDSDWSGNHHLQSNDTTETYDFNESCRDYNDILHCGASTSKHPDKKSLKTTNRKTKKSKKGLTELHELSNAKKDHCCAYCGKKYKSLNYLHTHEKQHTGEGILNCSYCDFTTIYQHSLKNHERKHSGEQVHSCKYCDFTASTYGVMERHTVKHTGQKKYRCKDCDYRTSDAWLLKRHSVKHTNFKPFICSECNFRSAIRMDLKKHERRNHGEMATKLLKNHKCVKCDYKSAYPQCLKRHVAQHHNGDRPYVCSIGLCDYKAVDKKLVRAHIARKHTGETIQCDQCPFETLDVSYLQRHKRIHGPRNCYCVEPGCGYRTFTRKDLHRHAKIHTDI